MMTTAAMRTKWQAWWRGLGNVARWLPLGLAGLFIGAHALLGGLRGDHAALAAAGLALYYAGPRLLEVRRFVLPLLIMTVLYDAQRYWVLALRGTVHVAEPRAWELAWFGVTTTTGVQTPAEWWQLHPHAVLDALTGAAYLAFVPVFLGCVAWWRFAEKRPQALQVMWAMLWLNLAAYVTYLIYPAAPPWYADHYGLGPAVLTALPEPGGAARFDALFNVTWFAGVYSRNANVFGAIPSLHVGQTFLAVLFAWRFRSLRVLTTSFWVLVTFGSVYLNHHYLVDGAIGISYALIAWFVVEQVHRRKKRNR